MKRKRILEGWNSFSQRVLPKDAPVVQREEMRRAFYAGAHDMLVQVKAISCENTEADAVGILNELQDEFDEYCKDLLRKSYGI